MLVVISIIAVLAALVFPALSVVQLQARTTKCLSNHRAVTTAYLTYLGEGNLLWYRAPDGTWSGGSGGLFGVQNTPGSPGYFCYLLSAYGLKMAKWNNWQPIPDRGNTVWYCPAAVGLSGLSGHGSTYFYNYPGTVIGATQAVSLAAVSSTISTNYYLNDLYGNHSDTSQTYPSRGTPPYKKTYSFLDGHSEYRP